SGRIRSLGGVRGRRGTQDHQQLGQIIMRWRQNNFDSARRLAVRWSAPSWRPRIIAATPVVRGWRANEFHDVRLDRQRIRISRPSSGALAYHAPQRVRSLKMPFLNLPRLRDNNPSTTEL